MRGLTGVIYIIIISFVNYERRNDQVLAQGKLWSEKSSCSQEIFLGPLLITLAYKSNYFVHYSLKS